MNKPHILLIDDNEIDLFLHEKLLRLSGISDHVVKFTMAAEALEHLQQGNSTDIILLDIQMPEMDGFEFLEKYELIPGLDHNHIRIFMVSSSLDFGDISKAKANPLVQDFIKKPLNIMELKELL